MSDQVLTGALVSVLLASPCVSEAQTVTPAATNRALFGADARDPQSSKKADLFMSLTMSDDSRSELVSRLRGERLDASMLRNGRYSALDGTLSFRRTLKRLELGFDTTSTLQYSSRPTDLITDHSANLTAVMRLGHRTQISASERILYAPSYRAPIISVPTSGPVQSTLPPSGSDAVSQVGGYSSATNVQLSQRLSQRSSVSLYYDHQTVDFSALDGGLVTWGGGGRFTRRLTQSASVRLGYGQRIARYGRLASDRNIRIHDLDLGIDYTRSVSRSTSLTVTPGSSIVATTQGNRYRPSAEVALNRRFGRTWNARMAYHRRSEFIEGFAAPFFADVTTATVAGSVGRRLQLSGSANYSQSEIGSGGKTSYDSESGSALATFAVTRHWAVFGEYLYYNHRLAGDITISTAASLDRHSVRAGLRWWRPLH